MHKNFFQPLGPRDYLRDPELAAQWCAAIIRAYAQRGVYELEPCARALVVIRALGYGDDLTVTPKDRETAQFWRGVRERAIELEETAVSPSEKTGQCLLYLTDLRAEMQTRAKLDQMAKATLQ